MGRPTKRQQINRKIGEGVSKFNEEVIKKLEQAFSYDCTIEEACLYAGITPATYYNNVNKKPQLIERFKALRNTPVLRARESVIESFRKDPALALKYLERKRRDEFALRSELTGGDGKPIEVKTLNENERNRLTQLIEQLRGGTRITQQQS